MTTDDIAARLAVLETKVGMLADIEEIRRLRYFYHRATNDGFYDQIPDMFTEDGALDFDYIGRASGRETIGRFFAKTPEVLPFIKQFIHNHLIDVDGDAGTGFCYLEAKTVAKGEAFLVAGRYDDEYLRVDGAWKFKPRFPRWIANLVTCLGDSSIRINAIPSSRRVKPVSPGG